MTGIKYNPNELLICIASRLMEDNATCFIGTGIPMLAASLAQKMHAPNLISIFEFGGMGAQLEKLPLAVGDMRMRTMHSISYAMTQFDMMAYYCSPSDMSLTDDFKSEITNRGNRFMEVESAADCIADVDVIYMEH